MIKSIINAVLGNSNDRAVKQYRQIANNINGLEKEIQSLNDDKLLEKSLELKAKVQNGMTLEEALPLAFALVRESGRRFANMRHFDVQLIGGIAMHYGNIAEMRTGEGKTLVCTLPAYLNALTGKGVHIVSVNDYLIKRDCDWMRPIYEGLGISVGCVLDQMPHKEKAENYGKDITYVNNSTLGFDYLRDNMKADPAEMFFLNKPFNYCIVDEADSILIDEARTPLIISGPSVENTEMYIRINAAIVLLKPDDFVVIEEEKSVHLTENGVDTIEKILNGYGILSGQLYDDKNFRIVNHVQQSLKAHKLFTKNKDYIVKDGEVLLIDEFTGRILAGRRYSEGLHQAIEAKEGVEIQRENQTLASITYQNLFRMYKKLAGMTGTAKTEEEEFIGIYNMKVIAIPTNNPVARKDYEDSVFLTKEQKNKAIIELVKEANGKGQPILIGTASVEYSEALSDVFRQNGIVHEVLNAKNHEREAKIISDAGKFGAITISTNMAGRGTDIKLGGNIDAMILDGTQNIEDEAQKAEIIVQIKEKYEVERQKVLEAGGLLVIGAERYESRRVDDQLRGRSGRQGDKGETIFMLSLEDDLLRIFGGDRIKSIVSKLGFKPGEAMNHSMLTRVIRYSQKRIESMNYDMRKNILKYDDVLNQQRIFMYTKRLNIIKNKDLMPEIKNMCHDFLTHTCAQAGLVAGQNLLNNQIVIDKIKEIFGREFGKDDAQNFENIDIAAQSLYNLCEDKLNGCILQHSSNIVDSVLMSIFISTLDELWQSHLSMMTALMDGIHLRSYGQKDPLNEYKIESYRNFDLIMTLFISMSLHRIMAFEIQD
ncbi:Protein translocase subunit SecA [Candidatus Deianiraea vastatrix]|uniref:Protein translocase subunit SecA n=1 Tax=Candidatus Deianiraea vastatrix TaxID=2163644 RepID=A0A5B8XEY2_9RICK|nr:preprotein translocase subunit SecA [Candidatus Deianiraea vastatrix]QED23868.1 Protein translocase subunit SecA [Candidatus Deianiraea vastatrix]